MATASSTNLLAIIIAIFVPPIGVFIDSGISREFWICLVLTLFFFVPGMIYALYVIL